ncbi:superoxide dismutase family protein [Streptomyces aidingensis]|uniref:Superoxide dismutase [Cu-Zn] n=1 Tax=Streptomyces aidingensis TaxID=910347 RepID=A0A1I1L3B0_9ACTN|nr:superoxide dismutase family protein [Streptomyces aidingensis]SFC67536.1 superoxide dismutase, Cu-Zn family [Streptomyces aidingensis]
MRSSRWRVRTAVAAAAAAALTATATAALPGGAAAAVAAPAAGAEGYWQHAWGELRQVPAGGGGQAPLRAVTYDTALVPEGAVIHVAHSVADGATSVVLSVRGLRPGHTYGAHVHAEPCGPDPQDAGPHYQNVTGDDPALANPDNEVWLDVTPGEDGRGWSRAHQDWVFRPAPARSVVLHARATSTGEDGRPAGDAGERVACFTVPFSPYHS